MRRGRPTEATCALVSAIPILPRPFRLVPQPGKLGSYGSVRSRTEARTTSFGGYGQTERKAFPVKGRGRRHTPAHSDVEVCRHTSNLEPGFGSAGATRGELQIIRQRSIVRTAGCPGAGRTWGSIRSQPGER